MKAVLVETYGPISSHRVQEVPEPVARPDELIVDVKAIGLNFPDALMLQGKYQKRPETPFVPGRDLTGIVRSVGSAVTRFKPGDRVMAQVFTGAFAEVTVVPEHRCFALADGVDFEAAAAMITVFNTAYVAVHLRAEAKPGQWAVVTGAAGGVGLAAVQLLKALGASVIALVSSDEKAELVRACGADVVVLTSGPDPKETIHDAVMAATGDRGADMVFETVGGETFANTLRTLGFGGKMIVIGFASGDIPSAKTNYLLYRNLSVMGAPLDIQFDHVYDRMVEGIALIQRLLTEGKVRPNIQKVFPFERFAEAFDMITGREVRGKVVLRVG